MFIHIQDAMNFFKVCFLFKVLFVVFSLCSGKLSLGVSSYLSRGYYEKDKSKYFSENMGRVLGRL